MNTIPPSPLWQLPDRPDPALWDEPRMRAALAHHDLRHVYQTLSLHGYSQQRIAALTGQSQPEVSSIIHNRRHVQAYAVLLGVARSLGIPLGYMGLSHCHCTHTTQHPHPDGARDPAGPGDIR
ncbi:MAG TPA: hypothetical protein VLJ59_07820 [Mycobacteriales bacterium]|nr:hypothetical protein [Mycobacteriales bacterium]